MSARPLEVRALAALLELDWETPEELAKALIEELDRVRVDKTSYIAVMQFGTEKPFYVGLGPYPGRKSAQAALLRHPSVGMATARAIVPVMSPQGLVEHLKEVG